jgi:hypothetical protein
MVDFKLGMTVCIAIENTDFNTYTLYKSLSFLQKYKSIN